MMFQASSSVIAAGPRIPFQSRAAVLDDPHKLAIFPLLVELAVGKIAWAWIQDLARFSLAIAGLAMAIEAGTFPSYNALPLAMLSGEVAIGFFSAFASAI